MKKISIYLVLIIIIITNLNSQNLQQGIKYLKLGNTLREAGDYESSKDYLEKGTKIIKKTKDNYWSASADEYMGYYYKDLSKLKNSENKDYFRALAISKLELAIEKYSRIKKNQPKASIEKIMREINNLKNNDNSDYKGLWAKNTYFTYDDKNIKKIPEDVSPKTTYLSLAKNKFNVFPNDALKLKHLEYLDLSDNKIKEIPNTIENLIKLKILKLKSNKIKNLPESISELSNLKYLDISNNSIKTIPDFIANLKSLEVLDLRKNNIPFEELKKLLQKMPNTQILHEKYVLEELKDNSETGDENE